MFRVGGFLSLFVLSLLSAGDPNSVPHIRFIVPTDGKAGNAFTLLGENFDPTPANNTIQFELPTGNLTAQVTSASETSLTGIVPNEVEADPIGTWQRVYRVTVTTDQGTSNGVGFGASEYDARLTLHPSWPFAAYVLLAPGSGTKTLVCGGGTPPYRLLPLDASVQNVAKVELIGAVIHVTGIAPGKLEIAVKDSSNPPLETEPSEVFVQAPAYRPPIDMRFNTLLAGAAPGFAIKSENRAGDMSTEQIEIRMENVEIDLSALSPYQGYIFGVWDVDAEVWGISSYQHFEVTDANDAQALFDLVSFETGGADIVANGTVTRDPPTLTLKMLDQNEGRVAQFSYDRDLIFFDRIIRLPQTPGEAFSVTATFTSLSVTEADHPMQHTVTRSFTTTGPVDPAPRIERLVPSHGAAGSDVHIRGTGFAGDYHDYQITFAGPAGTRVPASIHRLKEGEITVWVPIDAVTGPVRVALDGQSSNDFLFEVCFRPQADVSFSEGLQAGTPTGLLLRIEQPAAEDQNGRPTEFADEVSFVSASFALDAGSLILSGLTQGQVVGQCELENPVKSVTNTYQIKYGGQEPNEPMRHIFEIRRDNRIYASAGEGGIGVRFDLVNEGLFDPGRTVKIRFEQAIYRAPDTPGAHVNRRIEVVSDPWKGTPFAEMRVIKQRLLGIQ